MATAREIRRRMGSIRNIGQITRAMELIAVTRLRRAQQRVTASRPYAEKMRQVLGDLVRRIEQPPGPESQVQPRSAPGPGPASWTRDPPVAVHPLLERRPVQRIGVLLLTTDRGLCGALNSNTVRAALQYAYGQQNQGRAVEFVVVGRKGLRALSRLPVTVTAEFTALGENPTIARVAPMVRVATDAFASRTLDEVVLVYPQFISTLRQQPAVVSLLPIQPLQADQGRRATEVEYIYEPDPRAVLAQLLPRFVEVQVYQAMLDLLASEYSARMVAMRNATDNAKELLRDLQLGYNKVRQATVTREIIEVSAGANIPVR